MTLVRQFTDPAQFFVHCFVEQRFFFCLDDFDDTFMNTVTMSAIIVTIFFGGPAGPNFGLLPGWLWGFIWFFAKLLVFLFTFVWFRATLPRLRYDQLMDLGWKLLIPLALGWLMILGGIRVAQNGDFGFVDSAESTVGDTLIVMGIGLVIALIASGLLMAAIRTARTERLRGKGLVELPYGQETP